ncbi:MAG: hypothetical protein HFACDABA_02208 [Anaerolineales bacterium]|nr:hypothetical protein [Anaerolineales bacterium]
MDTSYLAGLIFVLAFAGMIFIHELGHYLASLWMGVEVEEFGFGIPPRAWRFWRGKGKLTVGNQTILIPNNFDLPFTASENLGRGVEVRLKRVNEKLILQTIQLAATEDGQFRAAQPIPFQGADGTWRMDGILHNVSQGTEFTLNWLPLGGFVRPKGENDPNIPGGLAAANPWKRLVVLFAGPLMNLIAGVFVISLLFAQIGIPDSSIVKIYSVEKDAPADLAGIRANDIVLSVNGEAITAQEQLRAAILASLDRPLEMIVLRDGEQVTLTATPSSARPAEIGALGIGMGSQYVPAESWFSTLPYSLDATWYQIHFFATLPGRIIGGEIDPELARFSGLYGIARVFQQTVEHDVTSRAVVTSSSVPEPTNLTLELIASLTITIGLFNLFPFPALDGGRILFVLPELLFRKRVPHQFENTVHAAGMLILLLFMLYVNVMDFVNPINIELPR